MTYHMERTMTPRKAKGTPKTNLDLDVALALGKVKRNFSCRLYDYLMNEPDSKILFWSKDGNSSIFNYNHTLH